MSYTHENRSFAYMHLCKDQLVGHACYLDLVPLNCNPVLYVLCQDQYRFVVSYNNCNPCAWHTVTFNHLPRPPLRVAVRWWDVTRHADGRGWEKMGNVEFKNFLSITSRKSYCISKIIIFEVSRWLTCDYSCRNNQSWPRSLSPYSLTPGVSLQANELNMAKTHYCTWCYLIRGKQSNLYLEPWWKVHHYTPRTTKLLGGILVSLRPSVRPSVPPAVSAL